MLKADSLSVPGPTTTEIVNFSLEARRGEVVALVGPNGSGKSIILRTLAGLNDNVHGSIKINNINVLKEPEKAKTQLGYLPNPVILEPYLTGFEILEMVGAMHNIAPELRPQKILTLAEHFDCKSQLYTTTERLGRAIWQKIGLMASLMHEPALLLWDEPTLHLDPYSQSAVTASVRHSAKEGVATVIATNDLSFAEALADKIVLLDNGETLAVGSLRQLCNQFKVGERRLWAVYSTAFNVQ